MHFVGVQECRSGFFEIFFKKIASFGLAPAHVCVLYEHVRVRAKISVEQSRTRSFCWLQHNDDRKNGIFNTKKTNLCTKTSNFGILCSRAEYLKSGFTVSWGKSIKKTCITNSSSNKKRSKRFWYYALKMKPCNKESCKHFDDGNIIIK